MSALSAVPNPQPALNDRSGCNQILRELVSLQDSIRSRRLSRMESIDEIEKLHRDILEMLNQLDSVSETATYLAAAREKHAYLTNAIAEEEIEEAIPGSDPRGHELTAAPDELQATCRHCGAPGTV